MAFTHDGEFHVGDVFGASLLRMLNPGIHILRGCEVPEGFDGIVFDIGGGAYDGHGETRFVSDFNPVPSADSDDFNHAFIEAVSWAQGVLERRITRMRGARMAPC